MHLQVSNVSKSFGRGSNAKLVLDQVSFLWSPAISKLWWAAPAQANPR